MEVVTQASTLLFWFNTIAVANNLMQHLSLSLSLFEYNELSLVEYDWLEMDIVSVRSAEDSPEISQILYIFMYPSPDVPVCSGFYFLIYRCVFSVVFKCYLINEEMCQ